jgi:hypothetical protein
MEKVEIQSSVKINECLKNAKIKEIYLRKTIKLLKLLSKSMMIFQMIF